MPVIYLRNAHGPSKSSSLTHEWCLATMWIVQITDGAG